MSFFLSYELCNRSKEAFLIVSFFSGQNFEIKGTTSEIKFNARFSKRAQLKNHLHKLDPLDLCSAQLEEIVLLCEKR